ncbi:DUF1295 domain-containing protein [bacterium]|nr:DUF1295 domain-containing protein [bacterium]
MPSLWSLPWWGLGLLLIAMTVLWLISLWRRDVSIVDPFWGTGFLMLAWTSIAWHSSRTTPRALLVCALVTIWSLRLSLYLLWRNAGHGEDERYAAMRRHHGPWFPWISLFTVFWLQAVILWIVAQPILAITTSSVTSEWNLWDILGATLWLIGFAFEAIGDWQLARFKANPANRGQVLRYGLWRYTRHPNYFGDFCVWWGFYLFAVADGASWTIISPVLMSILLMRISGVTLLESTIEERRPDYAEYRRTTNAFLPGLPKP